MLSMLTTVLAPDSIRSHSQAHLDAPGLCPLCLERYIAGRDGGGKVSLVEEVIDGVKTGKWICPYGGRTWYQQGARPFYPPKF